MNKQVLKPCPFCGSEGKVADNKNGAYWGRCTNLFCGCQLSCEQSYEEAVLAWNYRKLEIETK